MLRRAQPFVQVAVAKFQEGGWLAWSKTMQKSKLREGFSVS